MFKNLLVSVLCLFAQVLLAHGYGDEQPTLKTWSFATGHKNIEASFLMFKDGEVFLEDATHTVSHFPLAAFSTEDQSFVNQKNAQIEQINNDRLKIQSARQSSNNTGGGIWIAAFWLLLMAGGIYIAAQQNQRLVFGAFAVLLACGLFSFRSKIAERMLTTDPAFIDSAFQPFKPAVHTFWDANYFYVESKGIPSHQMMVGITAWQQQVPIPQCYIGTNSWPIPLNPVIAATPVPVNQQHFLRGAVAVAANGVAIFNPYTNTGIDALLDGQLDNFGGHCGRADDYHYHIAPLHLDAQTPDILPIAFALDGFAVYGSHEPDGSDMLPLDANHGHYGTDGVYHYHGTPTAPYMIGNMVGQVTEDNTMQIIPQAKAKPVRPSLTPLQGAVITDCQPNATNNGYTVTYTKGGQTYSVEYSWTNTGVYTFLFHSPTGTTTEVYNDFVPCEVPTAANEPAIANARVEVFPNPASGSFSVKWNAQVQPEDVKEITVYNVAGDVLYQSKQMTSTIAVDHFSKGIYFVKIQLRNQQITQKLIVN